MLRISVTPSFLKQFKKLDIGLREEAIEKLEILKDTQNHISLKVHKLHGKLNGKWSFSVNYQIRIVFDYLDASEIVLYAIGSHDVYR